MEKALLSLKEFCKYTGLGMTKAREIVKRPESYFTVRIGNRYYVNKMLLDQFLKECAETGVTI